MNTKTVSVSEAISFLNELIKLDKAAMTALAETRVLCNESLANHPTVQVSTAPEGEKVGLLGILNGLFGVDEKGWGFITAVFDDDGQIIEFRETTHEKK